MESTHIALIDNIISDNNEDIKDYKEYNIIEKYNVTPKM